MGGLNGRQPRDKRRKNIGWQLEDKSTDAVKFLSDTDRRALVDWSYHLIDWF